MAGTASYNSFEMPPAMKWALIISVIFHFVVVTAGMVGLPYIRKPPNLTDPIAVDIVEIDEITTTNKPPVKSRAMKEPEKLEAPKEEKPPAPPKMTAEAPPKSIPPTPPPLKEEVAKKPPPKVPPPPSEKLKEPPPKKPEPKTEDKPEIQQEDQFASLLKNLQDSEPTPVPDVEVNPDAVPQKASPLAQFSQRLTMSEADALRQQLSRCWSIQAGARYAEDLVVEVKLFMNPDRSVRQAVILNQWRYNQDGYFRAAADSAIRAVRSPMCNPLELPPDKYDLWKEIDVNFDPRDML